MGKNKEAGRGKNRPSSSSLSASLLPYGASNIGFGGYLGSSRVEPPATSDEVKPSATADGEIAQHIKRLSRKDPTTKLKALAALSAIFKQRTEDDIAQIIPLWAFEYRRLLNDYNREVRRATHETMTNLVITVRRGLAPHLKSLMGPWWVSQFDEIHEVSQCARRSFEAAFPATERRLDAVTLCSNEIVLHVDDNLKLVPQALSDKATPIDELEDIHHRVLSSSLLAIATLIGILVDVKADKEDKSREPKGALKARMTAISSLERLFSAQKYLSEFLKSKNSRVRSAAYSVLANMMKHMPHAIKEVNMKEFSASVLGSMHEKDPSCHSSMWDMILLFSKKFSDCWSHGSIQKNFMNMLWQFLRNGCFGSQKISYPNLILFLNSLPPKIVTGEQFMIRYFECLWAGRNPFYSHPQDQELFFKVFQECLLWSFFKAARFAAEERNFQVSLLDNVLIKLMWQDYLQVVTVKDQEREQSQNSSLLSVGAESTDSSLPRKHSTNYPVHYVNNLGNSLIVILSTLHLKDDGLFIKFCSEFLEGCLKIFQCEGQQQIFSERVERIAKFFLLLDQHPSGKHQQWALHSLAKPFVRKTFPLIKSLDSSDGVRLLSAIIHIFGPRPVFKNNLPLSKEQTEKGTVEECTSDSEPYHFLQFFKDEIIPWCLTGLSSSSNERLDLLIASLDKEFFHEQWDSILVYSMPCSAEWTSDVDRVYLLAMLMEKARATLISRKTLIASSLTDGSLAEHWRHALLDNAAIVIAHCPSGIYNARFLCSLIGGSSADHAICFLSEEAVALVLEAALKNFLSVLSASSYSWAKAACTTLQSIGCWNFVFSNELPIARLVEMAQFLFEILDGCIFSLSKLDKDRKLVSSVLAAVFIIEWESQVASQISSNAVSALESENKIGSGDLDNISNLRCSLEKTAKDFRCKIKSNIWRSLGTSNVLIIRGVLTETIRSVIFEVNPSLNNEIPSLCCSWVLEIHDVICCNHVEEQTMLDQLFAVNKNWPVWVAPDFRTGKRSATFICKTDASELLYHQFVAFVEKLLCNLGFAKVILGFLLEDQSSEEMLALNCATFPRIWLAAEILCSWEWGGGGSALQSFLPMLSDYAKTATNSKEDDIVPSLMNVLVDGAILHGTDDPVSFPNAWAVSQAELESIPGPFLRALVSVLWSVIVKESIWNRSDAIIFFENVVNRLVIGTSINASCLRILPFILNVVSQAIRRKHIADSILIDSFSTDPFSSNIVGWIQKVVSLPISVLHQTEEKDKEQWIQVITSCYPLSLVGCGRSFRVTEIGDIDQLEKVWLLNLFRKQRLATVESVAANKMMSPLFNSEMVSSTSVHVMLSKLTAVSVGYCWQEFNEDDWDFVLSQLQFLVRLSVPVMEEITEKVDEMVHSGATAETVAKKLEHTIQNVDLSLINLCSTALIVLSLISEVLHTEQEGNSSHFITCGRRSELTDNIREDVLRLFFATGAAEAISRSLNHQVALIVAKNRFRQSNFWELVASSVVSSPLHVKSSAVQAMELWGLSVGAVSSMFALLFSFEPLPSLQFAAYYFLSSDPVIRISLIKEDANTENDDNHLDSNLPNESVLMPDKPVSLRDELSCLIENPPLRLLDMDLAAHSRVNFFLAWALLLSYIQSLPSSSLAREHLVEYLQDSVSSVVLDCVFQHIPLKSGFLQYLKKKDVELPLEVSKAASAATCAINTSSLLFSVESLWPVGMEQMATFAGSIYGLMIRHLPAYVRDWFTRLRDRSLSAAIESFTKAWCSPPLIADEFAQIKEVVVSDENFSVTVNKSAYEVIATYKKEETGMDLVIRLPNCYPLRPVDVSCTRSLGISEVKQRKWLLSMTTFVRNQNGALAEAINTWKSNLNKEFQGVEECRICFSILHTSNHSLPRLPCKTCKNKFHSACLYKWFSTSQKSLCPLCQMPF